MYYDDEAKLVDARNQNENLQRVIISLETENKNLSDMLYSLCKMAGLAMVDDIPGLEYWYLKNKEAEDKVLKYKMDREIALSKLTERERQLLNLH